VDGPQVDADLLSWKWRAGVRPSWTRSLMDRSCDSFLFGCLSDAYARSAGSGCLELGPPGFRRSCSRQEHSRTPAMRIRLPRSGVRCSACAGYTHSDAWRGPACDLDDTYHL